MTQEGRAGTPARSHKSGKPRERKKRQILKLPSVAAQLLLQLRDLVELVEEPLVDGRQLMDTIDAHATMEGLGCRGRNNDKINRFTDEYKMY